MLVFGGARSGSSSSPKKRSQTDWKDDFPFPYVGPDTSQSFRRISRPKEIVWWAGLAGLAGTFQSDNDAVKIILEMDA